MSDQILKNLENLLQVPDLASKRSIYEQYDRQVMNDTIETGGDAALVRVHGTNKALAMTTDCTPRYVAADPFEGTKQAVAETYRNISATGATPLAITNCLNFGNPQKPEIMGQIVRAIKAIKESSIVLNYPVVSGNVSLYNETDGVAIKPTPAIGGVGLLKDLNQRCNIKLKNLDDQIYVIGPSRGHIGCSLYEREILKITESNQPPKVDLEQEKKHGEFVRKLIAQNIINACHDVSDGGILVALFEMCNANRAFEIDLSNLKNFEPNIDDNHLLFGEDQGRYLVAISLKDIPKLEKIVKENQIDIFKIANVITDKIKINQQEVEVSKLQELHDNFLRKKIFSN
jgi:phosphoribosylformylglycinamidine (FGAM) synthase-like enzyme